MNKLVETIDAASPGTVSDVLVITVGKRSGKTMTALEYMEKQLRKNSQNYAREFSRDAPEEVLNNIMTKMLYYAAAAEALEKVNGERK